jgi:hypothetical protein
MKLFFADATHAGQIRVREQIRVILPCGDRTRLLRNRQVYSPLRQIGRQIEELETSVFVGVGVKVKVCNDERVWCVVCGAGRRRRWWRAATGWCTGWRHGPPRRRPRCATCARATTSWRDTSRPPST